MVVRAKIEPPQEDTSKRVSAVFKSQSDRHRDSSVAGGIYVGFKGSCKHCVSRLHD